MRRICNSFRSSGGHLQTTNIGDVLFIETRGAQLVSDSIAFGPPPSVRRLSSQATYEYKD